MTTQGVENTLELYFMDVFKRHEYKLYTLVLHLTKSDEYAKDVVHEVFMKLWLQRSNIYSIVNIESWLYKLTENKVIDFLSKTSAERKLRDALWISMRNMAIETVEEQVSDKEYTNIIDKAIDQLPPQRKRIYRLSKANGLNYQEFIQYLKISRGTLKNQVSRIISGVKTLFQ
ncbi:MAG: sigma-70 family RNA polymerase sigma factor [Chitinophagaceae bacterium]|nr:sigma-70 family RNA polymerase sigma factor [Chitinophagaceae bacterium]